MDFKSNCDNCGVLYQLKKPNKKDHRFCSSRCRKSWHRSRNGQPSFIQEVIAKRQVKKANQNISFPSLPLSIASTTKSPQIIVGNTPLLTKLYTERNMLVGQLRPQTNGDLTKFGVTIAGSLIGYNMSEDSPVMGALLGALIGGYIGKNVAGNQQNPIEHNKAIYRRIKAIDTKIMKAKQTPLKLPEMPVMKEKNPLYNILESGELVKSQDSIKLNGKWRYFLGYLPNKFSALIYGKPKQGKTHLCLQFANYLHNNFGNVLYISGEEGAEDPFVEKYNGYECNFPIIDEVKGLKGISSAVIETKPKFVFIDSITRLGLDVDDIQEFKRKFPLVKFFYVAQATKDGRFRGSLGLEHEVTSTIQVNAGKAIQKGRTVSGETELSIFSNSTLLQQ